MSEEQIYPGGWSETKDADGEAHGICNQVKPEVEKKTGKSFKVFTAVQYRSQVVSGMNYCIKVHVGGDRYLHLTVWRKLSGETQLTDLEGDHKIDDPIIPA
ncbi:cystatin-A-like [Cheilinus undulatus]|uniref:cystatin-A-like n=1 Tax=Cheilinus undulatus TaxID=241271 RepID=UPI001BD1CA6D|nr:cystatin-A-like [Cheilinus undulatus]